MLNGIITSNRGLLPTLGGGAAIFDFTSRVAPDPRITFTRASNATDFSSAGVLTTEGNDVARFDYDPTTLQPRGFLVEGARTNVIRNGNATGAVVGIIGSGGALPTNWVNNSTAGMTLQVTATGTTNGLPWVRIRLNGTASLSSPLTFSPEPSTQVAAASGQNWAGSFYCRLVSGTLPNPQIAVTGRAAGGLPQETTATSIAPTSVTQRYSETRLLNDALTAFVQVDFRVTVVATTAYDFEIELGCYQNEQATFASSYIPTTGAAATRAQDVGTISNLASIGFNPTQGTMIVEFQIHQANNNWLFRITDNSGFGTDSLGVTVDSSGNLSARTVNSTVNTFNNVIAGVAINTVQKAAFSYSSAQASICLNGGSVSTDSSITLPVAVNLTKALIGVFDNNTGNLNGWIRRVIYYPTQLPDAQLQALTL